MSFFKKHKQVKHKPTLTIGHAKVVILYVLPALYLLSFHSFFVGSVVLGIAGSALCWLWAAFLLLVVCFCRYLCKDFLVERNGNMALGYLVKAAAFLLQLVIIIYCLSAILFFVATLFAYALQDIKALSQYQYYQGLPDKVVHFVKGLESPRLYQLLVSTFASSFWAYLLPSVAILALAPIAYLPLKNLLFFRLEATLLRRISLRTQRKTEGAFETQSDIDKEHEIAAIKKEFNPLKSYKLGHRKRHKNKLFWGMGDDGRPIYSNIEAFLATHTCIIGSTGVGKGVLTASLLTQTFLMGNANVIFDFKDDGGDKWMPHVLGEQLAEYNRKHPNNPRKMHFIDLNIDEPQINPMLNVSDTEFRELLGAGFNLANTGRDSDHYRQNDRAVMRRVSGFVDKAKCIPELWDLVIEQCPEILLTTRDKIKDSDWDAIKAGHLDKSDMAGYFSSFAQNLELLAQLPVIATREGIDLERAIFNQDIVYIVGSNSNFEVKLLQKMLLIRIKQIISKTSSNVDRPHVTIFCDETKYILSQTLLQAVGTIRDRRANILFNFQDIGNLRDVNQSDPSLNPSTVENEILGNSAIRMIYQVNHLSTREWASKMTGTKIVKEVSKQVKTNASDDPLEDNSTFHIKDGERNKYSTNVFDALQTCVGVVLGIGTPQRCFTAPIIVSKSDANRAVKSFPMYELKHSDIRFAGISQGKEKAVSSTDSAPINEKSDTGNVVSMSFAVNDTRAKKAVDKD